MSVLEFGYDDDLPYSAALMTCSFPYMFKFHAFQLAVPLLKVIFAILTGAVKGPCSSKCVQRLLRASFEGIRQASEGEVAF